MEPGIFQSTDWHSIHWVKPVSKSPQFFEPGTILTTNSIPSLALLRPGLWYWPSRILTNPLAEGHALQRKLPEGNLVLTWTGDSLHSLHLDLFRQYKQCIPFYILLPMKATHHSCLRSHSANNNNLLLLSKLSDYSYARKKCSEYMHSGYSLPCSPTSCGELCKSGPQNESSWGHLQERSRLGLPCMSGK